MNSRRVSILLTAIMVATVAAWSSPAAADHTAEPTAVTVTGSLQDELGCPGDWQPDCTTTGLSRDDSGVWTASFDVPVGDWEYKAAINGSWNENYGVGGIQDGPNIGLSLSGDGPVEFYYSPTTHWITDNVTSRIVTAPGSYQAAIGCPGDWQPECLSTWLQDPDGDGIYTYTTYTIPAGTYEAKAAVGRSWDENYGVGGVADGANLSFDVADGQTVTFYFESATNTMTIAGSGGSGGGGGGDGTYSTTIEPGDEALVTAPSRPPSDESVYFVMTDRFADGDSANDDGGVAGDRSVNGYDPTSKAYHHGGDIAGLRDRLDYIEGLGATAIWITPPFVNDWVQGTGDTASSSYHGYWQTDYTRIDPHLGSNAEMQAFIAEAHSRNIKVLFDVVLNHTGDVITYEEGSSAYRNKTDYPYTDVAGVAFDDRAYEGTDTFPELDPATSFPYTPVVPAGQENAKSPDWLNNPIYYHNRGDSSFTGENSQYGDFFGLDDLFSEHPVVVQGMIDIHNAMIDTFDIDGFRVDTVKHVSDGFWRAWVPAVLDHAEAAGKTDFVMFGEVYGETVQFRSRYSTELDFPGTLDFGFNAAARRFAAASAPAGELASFFASDDWYTDTDSNAHDLATFIGNHDEGRFGLEVVGDNAGASDDELADRVVLGQALNVLSRGRPVLYYGDEQGFVGDGGDQDARQDMDPSQVATYNDDDLIGTDATTADANFDTSHPLYVAISELNALRAASPGLQTGAQLTRYAADGAGVFAFSRIDGDERVEYLVALNNAEADQTVTFTTDTSSATWTALWPDTAPPATSDGDSAVTLTVPALGAMVYRADTAIDPPAAPGIAMIAPAGGSEVTGSVEVGADVADDGYAEVTFAVAVDGGDYEVIGVDDNAPYAVHHDVADYPAGTVLSYKAIVAMGGAAAASAGGATLASDRATVTVGAPEPPPTTTGAEYAIIHYQRPDGDYGDASTGDYNDYWGLHLWGDAIDPSEATDWTSPKPFVGEDDYGRFAWVKLADATQPLNFIVHRGDTKDGTNEDRSFNVGANAEIWLKADDPVAHTSRAGAQGFVTIHYQRPDGIYGDPVSADFNDYWGLHLWGDGIDPAEATDWTSPKPYDGIDEFGAYWTVAVADVTAPVNFIIHRGDTKDPGPDQSMTPTDGAAVWIVSGDETLHRSAGSAENYATIHYHRNDGDYGDPASADFADFWGLHVWAGAAEPNPSWSDPVRPAGFDGFGPYWRIPLVDGAPELAYIIHRGDDKDPGPDQFLSFATSGYEVWQLDGADPASPYIIPAPGGGGAMTGNGDLSKAKAHWVDATTIVWAAATDPALGYHLCSATLGGMAVPTGTGDGAAVPTGTGDGADTALDGADTCIELSLGAPYPDGIDGRLNLAGLPTLVIAEADRAVAAELLTGQVAVAAVAGDGLTVDATGLQIPGVLDDLYATDADLGVVWNGSTPTLALWAPTARSVSVQLFSGPRSDDGETLPMTRNGGVWSITGDSSWNGQYYLYQVEVYAPSVDQVATNLVTDPYSVSLARNSTRSQIIDLADPALAPTGWGDGSKPPLERFEDASVYELHVRDFSIHDETVPPADRGTFAAFTHPGSNGMAHLAALADAGLGYVHLLPSFDIATINEDPAARTEPDWATLETFGPASPDQQALISPLRDSDGFNWGYDPLHYTVPEGSYATDPDGTTRIIEFRGMVGALNGTGLRVVMDVVYNHTNASGQSEYSVLDRIVPGYYHRLDDNGAVAMSTCCANTATEHAMMGKLMIDSVVTWARDYKVDGFRFDLMGHHSKANMLELRAALDELTVADDGVDGSKILLYGEGWNFGEVADNARFVQATQLNLAGTGIATFSDRLRDAVRGGGPFDGGDDLVRNQGYISGLWYDPNEMALDAATARDRLLLAADQIRVGLAGNLADYSFVDRTGATVTGAQVDYNGSPAGYTADPQENIVYIAAHDNQTLFDIGQYHHPIGTTMADRVRAQNLGNAIVATAQGIPFFHAGQDMLRSKSMDRDSYNSGDWFNRLDFTYQTNNWGAGLPVEEVNGDNWYLIEPRLADPDLGPRRNDITLNAAVTREWLAIRASSPLFRLPTAQDVQARVGFANTGPDQIPGLIVMTLADGTAADGDGDSTGGSGALADLDPEIGGLVVLYNPTTESVSYADSAMAGRRVELHPILVDSVDPVVRTSTFDRTDGTFTVPARTAAVFVVDGPDTTPPVAEASLDLVQMRGVQGLYRVGASCSDDVEVATTDIRLNGVTVTPGQEVVLITRPGPQKVVDNGPTLIIMAPSFKLSVTCTDTSGNVGVATATP